MEVDWIYSSKTFHIHRKSSPKLESSRTTEERKAKNDFEKDSSRGSRKSRKAWKEVRALPQKRVRWHCFVEAQCSSEE
jgi:hypothetical protein